MNHFELRGLGALGSQVSSKIRGRYNSLCDMIRYFLKTKFKSSDWFVLIRSVLLLSQIFHLKHIT